MIPYAQLPALNACLNAACACLLAAGWLCVRRRRLGAHKALMLSATAVSALFLASYLVYHLQAGSKKFQGEGLVRAVYFAILLSHTVLAVVNVPLVLATLRHAWRGRLDRHARLARWTLPVWLYVSVTGVLVYMLLYVWYPGPGAP